MTFSDVPLINHWSLFFFFFIPFVFRLHSEFQAAVGRRLCTACQRPCHADLQSQTRSHCGDNDGGRPINPTATFLHMQWWQRGDSQLPPRLLPHPNSSPLLRISTSHQSQVTHSISFGMQWLNGIADTFLHVCWLLHHMLSLLICPTTWTS